MVLGGSGLHLVECWRPRGNAIDFTPTEIIDRLLDSVRGRDSERSLLRMQRWGIREMYDANRSFCNNKHHNAALCIATASEAPYAWFRASLRTPKCS